MTCIKAATLFLLLATVLTSSADEDFGVDCSWPVHSLDFKCGDLLGDRQAVYDEFMDGCRQHYARKSIRCDSTEVERIAMSVRQPQSMVNYTSTGFKKIRAPTRLFDLIVSHWNRNKNDKKQEVWPAGNIYTNHWASPTYMVSVEDTGLRGGGFGLKQKIWDSAKSTIEEWTGMELKPISLYGIREYTEGAILNPHVDRLPLVSSAIINVAQDVDEPWPLEVYGRDGKAVNVTMEPGDMVLYESGSLIHGRPFPLKGRYFANIFIHFEVTGRPLHDKTNAYLDDLDDFLPPYLLHDSPEVSNWIERNPHGWNRPSPSAPLQQSAPDTSEGHAAAATGDVSRLAIIARQDKKALTKTDRNGWQPIHEAVRGGHLPVVKFLIDNGADINARTHHGDGSSPLSLALDFLNVGDEVIKFLMENGAENIDAEEL